MDYVSILQNLKNMQIAKQYDQAQSDRGAFLGYTPDYSYGLAALGGANLTPDGRGHGSDKGKLPSHPTFSNQAVISGGKYTGGQWGRTTEGQDSYTPSQQMIQSGTKGLGKYMAEREPDVVLEAPVPYNMSNFYNNEGLAKLGK